MELHFVPRPAPGYPHPSAMAAGVSEDTVTLAPPPLPPAGTATPWCWTAAPGRIRSRTRDLEDQWMTSYVGGPGHWDEWSCAPRGFHLPRLGGRETNACRWMT